MIKILVFFIVSLLMFFGIALITNTTEYKDFKNTVFASSNDKYKIYQIRSSYESLIYSTNIPFEAAVYLIKIDASGVVHKLSQYKIIINNTIYCQGEDKYYNWIRENSLDKNK